MSETIFFNPGDSIGNFHDYNEAVRKGHLYKQKQRLDDELVVVNNKDANYNYMKLNFKESPIPKMPKYNKKKTWRFNHC
ncbi:hypothetical protein ODR38_09480 [Pediococcus acidilactici]